MESDLPWVGGMVRDITNKKATCSPSWGSTILEVWFLIATVAGGQAKSDCPGKNLTQCPTTIRGRGEKRLKGKRIWVRPVYGENIYWEENQRIISLKNSAYEDY